MLYSSKPSAWPALGIALGLIVNLYFPQNIEFIINHIAPKIGSPTIAVDNEKSLSLTRYFSAAATTWHARGEAWPTRQLDRVGSGKDVPHISPYQADSAPSTTFLKLYLL